MNASRDRSCQDLVRCHRFNGRFSCVRSALKVARANPVNWIIDKYHISWPSMWERSSALCVVDVWRIEALYKMNPIVEGRGGADAMRAVG